jgi:hypothetical protein
VEREAADADTVQIQSPRFGNSHKSFDQEIEGLHGVLAVPIPVQFRADLRHYSLIPTSAQLVENACMAVTSAMAATEAVVFAPASVHRANCRVLLFREG